jgi:serine/threonine-protein kinase
VGETALAVAVQHVNSSPEPVAKLRPDLPPELARIVHKMLNKKPDDRYAGARDILHDLHRLATSSGLMDPSEAAKNTEQWATADLAMLGDPRFDSTHSDSTRSDSTMRLDHLMKTTAMLASPRRHWRRLLLGMAVAAALGAAIAAVTRSSPLLSAADSPDVPTRQTVWAQLYHAKMTDTEAAWMAVWQRFDNPYTAKLAKQGLVRHYIVQTAEYDKALPLLDELAALGDTDRSFVAFGLAGRCVALHRMNRPEEALAAVARLDSDMKDQLDPQMRRMFDRAVERSRR